MAKNISNNQWFKDIADDMYLYTAVLNDILFIMVKPAKSRVDAGTTIATLSNPELFQKGSDNNLTNYNGESLRIVNGKLVTYGDMYIGYTAFTYMPLKSKQLETDFYSPEQLAKMYPDDPAYQVATAELTDETKHVG